MLYFALILFGILQIFRKRKFLQQRLSVLKFILRTLPLTFLCDVFKTPLPLCFLAPLPSSLLFQTRKQIEGTKNLIEPNTKIRLHETHSWPGLNYM